MLRGGTGRRLGLGSALTKVFGALLFVLALPAAAQRGQPRSPAAEIGCAGARIDRPSLGQTAAEIAIVFPTRRCAGVRPGEAAILERRGGRWRRLAVLPYDRGANQSGRGYGRRFYRFANDRDQPADMWIDGQVLVVMRVGETLLRRALSR